MLSTAKWPEITTANPWAHPPSLNLSFSLCLSLLLLVLFHPLLFLLDLHLSLLCPLLLHLETEDGTVTMVDLRVNGACPEDVNNICCENFDLNKLPPTSEAPVTQCGQRNEVGVGANFQGFNVSCFYLRCLKRKFWYIFLSLFFYFCSCLFLSLLLPPRLLVVLVG